MLVESTSLHAWMPGDLMGKSAAVANGSEDGYISGLSYRRSNHRGTLRTEIELPLPGRDRQGWPGPFHVVGGGMLCPRRI
jgi:hypothetical protein